MGLTSGGADAAFRIALEDPLDLFGDRRKWNLAQGRRADRLRIGRVGRDQADLADPDAKPAAWPSPSAGE